jgi:hypothetical protein
MDEIPHNSADTDKDLVSPRCRRPVRTFLRLALAGVVLYLVIAYALLPLAWRTHEKHHPALADAPRLTHTANGIPGDPLNVGLVGTEEELHRAMLAARWYPADPTTLRSAMRIAVGVVFDRPYDDAPVSSLYLWGRKEDLAFEQPVGNDPKRRHHVRFWRSGKVDEQGKPLWLGAATFDTHVGLSYTTGQITHHISPEVDLERDKVINDIRHARDLSASYWIDGFHKELEGKNGGGDPWKTDGRLEVGVISISKTPQPALRTQESK